MAITHRQGPLIKFDSAKMVPGEWAFPDDGTARYCVSAGIVKTAATVEDMAEAISDADQIIIDELTAGANAVANVVEGVLDGVNNVIDDTTETPYTIKVNNGELFLEETALDPNPPISTTILDDIADLQANKLSTGNDYRPNLLANGDFIVWQRGNTFSNPQSAYTADRWNCGYNGTGATNTITHQVSSDFGDIFRWECTAIGTGCTYKILNQHIENVRRFSGDIITVSFYARAVSGSNITVQAALAQNFGAGGSASVYHFGQAVTLSTSWTKYTAAITLSSVLGKTIGDNNYLSFEIILPQGALFSVDFSEIKIEQNDHATPFIPRTYAEELAICQRYYFKPTHQLCTRLSFWSNNVLFFDVPIPVPMRTNPSIVGIAGTDYTIDNMNGAVLTQGYTYGCMLSGSTLEITATKTSHGVTDGILVITTNSGFDAEL